MTFAAGTAVTTAAETLVAKLRERAALIWGIDTDAIEWRDGMRCLLVRMRAILNLCLCRK
ncbi:MAG: hypothetical protein CM1200mP24_00040 [Gammaproteobacteria bacterium]|nr:MAG: hypothetical protein CM1200mP24_00040 [Gammaproteobacteria bacterium]